MNDENKISDTIRYLSQIVSDILSPFLIPAYGMVVALWMTPLREVSFANRIISTLFVFFVTGVIPFVTIMIMRYTGHVSDNSISKRHQRPIPFIFGISCYVITGYVVGMAKAPFWLEWFFYGAAIAAVIALMINFKWKISAHTTSMGGFTALISWLIYDNIADFNAMGMLSLCIIASGAVATSRLFLSRHTVMQVTAGYALGFISTFGLVYLIS